MATELSTNFVQIKRLYMSVLCVSITFFILLLVLSISFHYKEGQLEPFIIVLVFGLTLRLIALYGLLKESYGLTIGFAIIMTFFLVFTFINVTVGIHHSRNTNIISFFLHCVTTLLAYLFAYKIREKQMQQIATIIFCSPTVPTMINGNPHSFTSPTSLTAPVHMNFINTMQNIVPPELDLPPKYEQVVCYPNFNSNNQRV